MTTAPHPQRLSVPLYCWVFFLLCLFLTQGGSMPGSTLGGPESWQRRVTSRQKWATDKLDFLSLVLFTFSLFQLTVCPLAVLLYL